MAAEPRGMEAVQALIDKGVEIPNPWTVDIGPEVNLDQVSGEGVRIYPGCRIYGAKTVISAGCTLGAEGPVTIDNCRLGPNVALKGGYAAKAVFLDGANMGLGHHVREGSLLEEEANGAHTVGLKQTILFPFVTLGSLINFCDALMAGGTSRKDHSEVGSSYIHFNYTPHGDKTTPSLFGDVARGVMLNQPPIFLGGQGGSVGPVSVGYGSVVGAGSVLRDDIPDGQLAMRSQGAKLMKPFVQSTTKDVWRVVAKNVTYLANLRALQAWYEQVRAPFFAAQEFGDLVQAGAQEMLATAVKERTKRLEAMVGKVDPANNDAKLLQERIAEVCTVVTTGGQQPAAPADLVSAVSQAATDKVPYTAAIQALPAELRAAGTTWLQAIEHTAWQQAQQLLPALEGQVH